MDEQAQLPFVPAVLPLFDKIAMEKVGELSDVNVIVTDGGIFEDTLKKYKENVNIITV